MPMLSRRRRSRRPTLSRKEVISRMSQLQKAGLSTEELEAQQGEQLPDREQMSLINANVAAPINAAIALNVLSDGSVAYANAQQTAPITQSNLPPPA